MLVPQKEKKKENMACQDNFKDSVKIKLRHIKLPLTHFQLEDNTHMCLHRNTLCVKSSHFQRDTYITSSPIYMTVHHLQIPSCFLS